MDRKNKKAAVALSGGVDSAVAALLLKNQGYEVIGITGKMVNSPGADKVCENAKIVADKLGIQHYIYDVTENFEEKIIKYFENSYATGKTPNPCIMCNQFIKFGELLDYAVNELGADFYSTGHYAKIINENGIHKLYPAKDSHKDQLYFLYRLNQNQLSRMLFPLADYEKNQVRQMAVDADLPPKSSKESQDICFIEKPNTTKKYLNDKFGIKKGDFIDIKDGKKWGEHTGTYQYTIGQRKGIGIAAPYPLYVIDIDAGKNIVYLGREEDNYKKQLSVTDVNLTYPDCPQEFDAMVKIRYNMHAQKAHVKLNGTNADIEFYAPVNSITKGQAGVFYDINDGHLIGGGWVN